MLIKYRLIEAQKKKYQENEDRKKSLLPLPDIVFA